MVEISVIIPVYYEQDCIQTCIDKVSSELERHFTHYEIIFIDDGSEDSTSKIINENIKVRDHIRLIELSYNHGKQGAISAGIYSTKGEYILMMDPDLQDPETDIVKMYNRIIKEQVDVVYGVRDEKEDSKLNKLFSHTFWNFLRRWTGLNIPEGLAVIRIFNRNFANQFMKYKEQNRFLEGIFFDIGMKQAFFEVNHQARKEGNTKYTFKKKVNLALDAILDFSELPLIILIKLGFWMTFIGFVSLVTIIFIKLLLVDFQQGWLSVISAVTIGAGVNLSAIGVIGAYVGRIYKETKSRPLFSVKHRENFND